MFAGNFCTILHFSGCLSPGPPREPHYYNSNQTKKSLQVGKSGIFHWQAANSELCTPGRKASKIILTPILQNPSALNVYAVLWHFVVTFPHFYGYSSGGATHSGGAVSRVRNPFGCSGDSARWPDWNGKSEKSAALIPADRCWDSGLSGPPDTIHTALSMLESSSWSEIPRLAECSPTACLAVIYEIICHQLGS